jgi:hypothetical protein
LKEEALMGSSSNEDGPQRKRKKARPHTRMSRKKKEAALRLEDQKSTAESVSEKLRQAHADILDYAKADLKLSSKEWAALTKTIQVAIASAKNSGEIQKVISDVSTARYLLVQLREPIPSDDDVSQASPLASDLLTQIQKLSPTSLLRTGYDGRSFLKEPLYLLDAWASYLGAQKLLEDRKLSKANQLARRANDVFGNVKSYSPKDAGTKGGNSKARNTKPAKELIVKLLVELTPESGWKSLRRASCVIAECLVGPKNFKEAYVKVLGRSGLNPDSFQKTVYEWFLDDDKLDRKDRQFNIRLAK